MQPKPLAFVNLPRVRWKMQQGGAELTTFSAASHEPENCPPHHRLSDPIYDQCEVNKLLDHIKHLEAENKRLERVAGAYKMGTVRETIHSPIRHMKESEK